MAIISCQPSNWAARLLPQSRGRVAMRFSSFLAACGLSVVMFGLADAARAVEPWADRNLSVRDGLALWLDVTAQQAGRQAQNQPPLDEGQPGVGVLDAVAG